MDTVVAGRTPLSASRHAAREGLLFVQVLFNGWNTIGMYVDLPWFRSFCCEED
jgi:hypothetical protein